MAARLRGFLDDPLSGLTPWIVMAVMSGIVPFEAAVALSFAAAAAILAANTITGGSQKSLEYFDTAYFLLLGIVGLVADEDVREWPRVWADELSGTSPDRDRDRLDRRSPPVRPMRRGFAQGRWLARTRPPRTNRPARDRVADVNCETCCRSSPPASARTRSGRSPGAAPRSLRTGRLAARRAPEPAARRGADYSAELPAAMTRRLSASSRTDSSTPCSRATSRS